MKQQDDFPGEAVPAAQVRPLRQIAPVATQGQVRRVVVPFVLTGDDVFDVEGQEWVIGLMNAAILAPAPGP
jgi:hypothetical protein